MDSAFTCVDRAPNVAAISWSAGKDSCLALLRAREAGLDVRSFLTMLDPGGMSKSHALPRDLIAAHVQAHRDWLEPVCAAAGLQAGFPLRGLARSAVAAEVIARGIRAQLVCADTRWLDDSFCGAEYDAALLARLPPGVCPAGEGGEFHSFVRDAPGFAAPLPVRPGPLRRVATAPPLSPTTRVLQTPWLTATVPPVTARARA